MQLSQKQKEFWNEPPHRWNIKTGATRSGKTWLDYYVIPKRIRELGDKAGDVLLLGATQGTVDRNVLEPMRKLYGDIYISKISGNDVMMFGRRCYVLGADNIRQVDKIRGMSVAYCYGDEIVTWNKEVFAMLQSRLDKPYSCFDGTCNPDSPNHWFKHFLDSKADIFQQQYTIDDNPFLPKEFVENLKLEYEGSIYYDRYILGEWTAVEGLILTNYVIEEFDTNIHTFDQFVYAQDFGYNHADVILGVGFRDNEIYVCSEIYVHEKDTSEIIEMANEKRLNKEIIMYCDSAEPDRIKMWKKAGYRAKGVVKGKGSVHAQIDYLQQHKIHIHPLCVNTIKELQQWCWKKDVSGTTTDEPVDIFDDAMACLRYAVEDMRRTKVTANLFKGGI